MTAQPILFVTGLGRCGTTMMMTMLDAGGFPVTGPRPSYEAVGHWKPGRFDFDWLAGRGGQAVKWIDPTAYPITALTRFLLPCRPTIILMERNAREQARSQVKLFAAALLTPTRTAEKAMERSIRRDTPILRARLGALGTVHRFRFEDVLADPVRATMRLAKIVEPFGHSLNAVRARDAVIDRNAACLPHLHMEESILPLLAEQLERGAA